MLDSSRVIGVLSVRVITNSPDCTDGVFLARVTSGYGRGDCTPGGIVFDAWGGVSTEDFMLDSSHTRFFKRFSPLTFSVRDSQGDYAGRYYPACCLRFIKEEVR